MITPGVCGVPDMFNVLTFPVTGHNALFAVTCTVPPANPDGICTPTALRFEAVLNVTPDGNVQINSSAFALAATEKLAVVLHNPVAAGFAVIALVITGTMLTILLHRGALSVAHWLTAVTQIFPAAPVKLYPAGNAISVVLP